MPSLPYWLWPGDGRPTPEIDAEIAEELQLHLDLLAEERVRDGASPDDAQRQAAERFGDFDRYLRLCRVEKQGDIPMLKRVQAVSTVLLLIGVVWLGFHEFVSRANNAQFRTQTMNQLQEISSKLEMINNRPTATAAPPSDDDRHFSAPPEAQAAVGMSPPSLPLDPTDPFVAQSRKEHVRVLDQDNQPVANAQVRVYWSGIGGFAARVHTKQVTDENGLAAVAVSSGSGGIESVEAWAPGFIYSSPKTFPSEDGRGITVRLTRAISFRVRVSGTMSSRRLSVIPISRTDLSDHTHKAPTDGTDRSLWKQTNEAGEVELDWLLPGDIAKVGLKERGRPVEEARNVEFVVPEDPSKVVVIKLEDPNRRRGGFGSRGGLGDRINGGYQIGFERAADSGWLPPDNADPETIRDEAKADAVEGRFDDALAKQVWYFENAHRIKPSLSAVRLSFALSEWYELGLEHPPALQKLRSVRDGLEERAKSGEDLGGGFHELAAINRTLGEDARTVEAFEELDSANPKAARDAIHFARQALLNEGAYELYAKHIDSKPTYYQTESIYEMMSGNPRMAEMAEPDFRRKVATLVAVLARVGRNDEAVEVVALAEEKLDDPEFREELNAALKGQFPDPTARKQRLLKEAMSSLKP